MGHSYMSHTNREPDLRVACETQIGNQGQGFAYPVLVIGDATFFPTLQQLEKLHSVVGKYLESRQPHFTDETQAAHEAFASGG
jgi:hypothetical protein